MLLDSMTVCKKIYFKHADYLQSMVYLYVTCYKNGGFANV